MPLHVLCIGAHPDDNEVYAGGTAARFHLRGDIVRFLAVTDGSKGHFEDRYIADPESLVRRRHEESLKSTGLIGAEYDNMGVADGELYVTPGHTEEMVRAIRSFGEPGVGPDIILLNRPNDYHRDHRYAAQLVLDAAYMLTVPPMCPDTPALRRMPVIAYWHDNFTEGGAFRPDIAVPIDSVFETKVDMLCAHASQFFEWIPYNEGSHSFFADFPEDPAARRERMAGWIRQMGKEVRELCSAQLPGGCQYAEAFQLSEYGTMPSREELSSLFPTGK